MTPEANDDWRNWLRIAKRGYEFDCVEMPMLFVRRHSESLTVTQRYDVLRRELGTVDQIRSECNIPKAVLDKAYARISWPLCVEALRQDDIHQAVLYFRQAVSHDPTLLDHSDTYFTLARWGESAAGQERSALIRGRLESIAVMLRDLFSWDQLPQVIAGRADASWGLAYLCLARMAHGLVPPNEAVARTMLMRALSKDPRLLLYRGTSVWVLRILAGQRLCRVGHRLKARLEQYCKV